MGGDGAANAEGLTSQVDARELFPPVPVRLGRHGEVLGLQGRGEVGENERYGVSD